MKIRGYDCCYEGSENLCHSNGFVLVLSSESSTHLPYTCKQWVVFSKIAKLNSQMCHHHYWFLCKMTAEEQAQKSHSDGMWLTRSTNQIWEATHHSTGNFCAWSSDIIMEENSHCIVTCCHLWWITRVLSRRPKPPSGIQGHASPKFFWNEYALRCNLVHFETWLCP